MPDGAVPVTFAEGVKGDISGLLATASRSMTASEVEALAQRVAQLLLACKTNPYEGEAMGAGRHPELARCRRIRFDVPTYPGKPRFRLIYRNEPSDGAPAECRWLALGPRAGLATHRRAVARLGSAGK
jgi:hypothetical protein